MDPQLLLPLGAGLVVEQVQLCDEIVHVTVDANGYVTAWVTDYNFECHGTASF